jgi:hypothetical protein
MTISTTESRISYNGNSATTVFSFPYRFLVNGDLVVVEVSAAGVEVVKTITTDYTITGAGDDAGGSVTMLVAPATGTRLVIYRDTEVVQETDYTSGDAFPAESHERALDRLTMILQEKTPGAAGATRAIQIPIGDPGDVNTVLPPSIARLGKFLIFDATTGSVGVSDVTSSQVEVAVEELGLVETTVNVFTKNQSVLPVALTPGATVNVDASLSNAFTLTPDQNFTLAAPTNATDGMVCNFVFTQGGTPYTITFDAAWQFAGGTEPTLTASASAVDFMSCYYNGATSKWICVMNKDFKA